MWVDSTNLLFILILTFSYSISFITSSKTYPTISFLFFLFFFLSIHPNVYFHLFFSFGFIGSFVPLHARRHTKSECMFVFVNIIYLYWNSVTIGAFFVFLSSSSSLIFFYFFLFSNGFLFFETVCASEYINMHNLQQKYIQSPKLKCVSALRSRCRSQWTHWIELNG